MFKKFITIFSVLSLLTINQLSAVKIADNPFIDYKYPRGSVTRAIQDLEKRKYNKTAAKGLVGEIAAEQMMREKGYISIRALFKMNGCNVSFRHSGDQGIDNVYVVQSRNGWIDRRYKPIFHESKYRTNCRPRLASTKRISEQLSLDWLNQNLQKTTRKTNQMCVSYPSGDKLELKACVNCRSTFKAHLGWLKESLESKSFKRSVSVLCPDGTFKAFFVTE